jgi:threonine/homoserine/homoserine lactone efflux protein
MLEFILIGSGFAFAAAIQPGPLQAFLLSSVAQKGWRRTLPASFAPLLSDGPIAVLTLLVLNRLPDGFSRILQAAGGVFLIYLAWAGYRQWRQNTPVDSVAGQTAPRTLLQAAFVNLLNPSPYLGWSLVLGPAFLAAWQKTPADAAALLLAFYITMVAVLAGTILLFGTTRFLGPEGRRALILISAATLGVLGIYQLVASVLRTATG